MIFAVPISRSTYIGCVSRTPERFISARLMSGGFPNTIFPPNDFDFKFYIWRRFVKISTRTRTLSVYEHKTFFVRAVFRKKLIWDTILLFSLCPITSLTVLVRKPFPRTRSPHISSFRTTYFFLPWLPSPESCFHVTCPETVTAYLSLWFTTFRTAFSEHCADSRPDTQPRPVIFYKGTNVPYD